MVGAFDAEGERKGIAVTFLFALGCSISPNVDMITQEDFFCK